MDPRVNKQSLDISELISAAEQGDPRAQSNLGWCYYIGNGVAEDRREAVKWYRKAAEQGLENAQEMLSLIEANLQSQPDKKGAMQAAVERHGESKDRRLYSIAIALLFISLILLGAYSLNTTSLFRQNTTEAEKHEVEQDDFQPHVKIESVDEDPNAIVEGNHGEKRESPTESFEHDVDLDKLLMNRLTALSEEWLDGGREVNDASSAR